MKYRKVWVWSCSVRPATATRAMEATTQGPSMLGLLGYLLPLFCGLVVQVQARSGTGVRDYCQFESFNATCGPGKVVLMESARYGRMRIGRCVTRDYGYIRCAADVLNELDRRCSGRSNCHFQIPSLRDSVQPCPKDLTSYLEASYSCVEVASLENFTCQRPGSVLISAPSGYISSQPVQRYGYGSRRCPVTIRGLPGQHINFTLYNFAPMDRYDVKTDSSVVMERVCPYYAIVKDIHGTFTENLTLCGGDSRENHVFLSKYSAVTLYIGNSSSNHAGTAKHVLLKFNVVGCPHPLPPRNAWVHRNRDRAVIRCNHTSETWYLTCRGTAWVGNVHNCTVVSPLSTNSGSVDAGEAEPFPLGLLIAITIGVILGIVIGLVLLIGVFFYRRRARRQRLRSKANELLDDETSQENEENYARRLMQASDVRSTGAGSLKRGNGLGGDYTQMWELRRAAQAGGAHTAAAECGAVQESPYGGTLSITSTTTLPLNCCNKANNTFSTFKPRAECPYGERPHVQVGVDAILRQSLAQGMPMVLEYEPGGAADCDHGSRPDLLSDNQNPYGTREEVVAAGAHHCPRGGAAGMRDLCDQCAVNSRAEVVSSDANSHDSNTQSV